MPLRVVTSRIASSSPWQLPYIVPSLAATILTCGQILSGVETQSKGKDKSEASVIIHKYKTQLSTLLQEKTREARWAGVVLVKATVEAGGYEILHISAAWVRGLIGLLGVCAFLSYVSRKFQCGYSRLQKTVFVIELYLERGMAILTDRSTI